MAPLRVLFVIPGEGKTSSMIFARRQAESLASEGVAVECFYLRSRTSPALLLREFRRLRRCIRQFRPRVLHAHFGTVTAAFVALAAGTLPLVITYRGSDLNPCSRGPRARLGRLFSQLAALRASRLICVSQALRRRLWWRRHLAMVMPSGVDTELFRPESRASARARLGWPLEQAVVLFNAGHDPRNKRLDLAVASEAVAREIRHGLRLEVLDGQVDPRRVPTLMNASSCLLIASDWEGSPTVLQEALACGLPVVSVDVGDAAERLRGITHTRLVPRDPAVMGRAVAELASAPRTNGPTVANALSLHRIARELCRLYAEALGSPPAATVSGEVDYSSETS